MNRRLQQRQEHSLLDDPRTSQTIALNHQRNKAQDHTGEIDAVAARFDYAACSEEWWNPESYSLLHGTALWDGASERQRRLLNHLYWVAYYAQIISAEIATILLNQTSAAGLASLEDFRPVCDTLDLETAQERGHIQAFKAIGEAVEAELFGERLFTYPMRSMYVETMLYADANRVRRFWKSLQLRAFGLLSSDNAFIGCQYFTVRGLRTLNGKMIQYALAEPAMRAPDPTATPIPSQISRLHFIDESFHFTSSCIISRDVLHSLRPPTPFERWVANRALLGCQRDHFHFSVAVKGIFWYDPALFRTIYRLLRGPAFGMRERDAREMLQRCFTEESAGLHEAYRIHREAVESYRAYVAPLEYVSPDNREMRVMAGSTLEGYLRRTRSALARFEAAA